MDNTQTAAVGSAAAVIDRILLVQAHDCRIRDMEGEARDVPARKQEEEVRLNEHKQALSQGEDALKHKQAELKKLDLEVEARKEKIAKFRQQQLEIKTNKEFRAIETEIATVQKDISGIEDRELVLMEEAETLKADVAGKAKALKIEQAAVQKDIQTLDERLARLQEELKVEREKRSAVATGIDAEWLRTYEAIIHRRDRALVPIEEGVCGGCHMKLPPAMIHETRRRAGMVQCNHCGRLVY